MVLITKSLALMEIIYYYRLQDASLMGRMPMLTLYVFKVAIGLLPKVILSQT